ncbi:UDP-glucuronic acid decarboxylase family protein [Rhodococcus sp. NPDC058521]|uniref:UDP-glucuronic acid decarboxylase family protein n=1 Tax=Rhodococcus sp. NPDC058521 TaxID=3346536 RepID=UPI0036576B9D
MPRFERALVTGGAGFLGSHLCEQLSSAGTVVYCLDNLSTGDHANVAHLQRDRGFAFVAHDVTEPIPDLGPIDVVFHLASPASPVDYLSLPIETMSAGAYGTRNALDFAARTNARFVLASTSEVYGDPLEHPQRETYWGNVNPVGSRSVYDEAKRYGEALCSAYERQNSCDTAIARIFNTYGPRMRDDDGRMIPTFIDQALRGSPITVAGTGKQTRSLCYVDDTVAGLRALAESDETGPINIGNPGELSVRSVAERIRTITDSRCDIIEVAPAADDPQRRCPDITRARSLLDWSPVVDVDTGLRRTIEWVRERPHAA